MTVKAKVFLVVLGSLAAIGFIKVLHDNPVMLLLSVVLTIAVIYMFNYLMTSRRSSDQGYQKALRNQKNKGKMSRNEMQKLTRLKRPKRDIPFRVIEGSKGKGKNTKDKEKRTNIH